MRHQDAHPVPKDGCFGCRVSGIGFQGLQSEQGKDPVKVTQVDQRGSTQTEHWDGRVDARVVAGG